MGSSSRISTRGLRILLFWVVVGCCVVLDQATKAVVRLLAPTTGYIGTLIPGVINLARVENTGAAFSIGQGAGGLFVGVAIVCIGATFALVVTEDLPISLTISLACVAGGGAGNMVDRLMRGSVTDFLAAAFMDFPVFNVADIFVTCGIASCFICYLVMERRTAREEGETGTTEPLDSME